MTYISTLSGGRDSTAMTVKLLEDGYPLDHIVFCDTGYELPEMYDYIDRLNHWLKWKFDREITIIKASATIEEWAFGRIADNPRFKRPNQVRGLPMRIGMDYCTRELKIKPVSTFAKSVSGDGGFALYIGYVARENRQASGEADEYLYPLKEWGWNEPEVDEYLKEKCIYNELYENFSRTGCWLCPKQSKKSWFQIWKNYPDQWNYAKSLEDKLEDQDAINPTFRDGYQKLESLEREFIAVEKRPQFDFEWNDEQVSCFCK